MVFYSIKKLYSNIMNKVLLQNDLWKEKFSQKMFSNMYNSLTLFIRIKFNQTNVTHTSCVFK